MKEKKIKQAESKAVMSAIFTKSINSDYKLHSRTGQAVPEESTPNEPNFNLADIKSTQVYFFMIQGLWYYNHISM